MESYPRPLLMVGGALVAAVSAYPFLTPGSAAAWIVYDLVAVVAIGIALWGVVHRRPARRGGWMLVIGGFAGWVVGDLEFTVEQGLWNLTTYPLPSDAIYLGAYGFLVVGTLVMVQTRGAARDMTAMLDAAIIATGSAVVAAVFLIEPLARNSELTEFGRVVSAAYPVMDVLLIAVVVRMWAEPGARTPSYRWLVSGLLLTLAADTILNVFMLTSGSMADSWSNTLYLASYLALAAAACVPSMSSLGQVPRDRPDATHARRRLVVLAGGLMLPAVTLLIEGATGARVLWQVIGLGMLAISALVLVRMAGILRVVEVQADVLTDLARLDELTGVPNRRTWDFELARACAASVVDDTPLSVAIIDLDHFKEYNDTHGHQAGDDLLRAAVRAWRAHLGDGIFLARYGGDEFTVLLPGLTAPAAREIVDGLRAVTPHAQTISVGVTSWDPQTGPASAVAGADRALYEAKRLGRNRAEISSGALVGLTESGPNGSLPA